jgi:hypothetical protein
MVSSVSALPSAVHLPLPAVEAFPTSLSVIHLTGIDGDLGKEVTGRLREIEQLLHSEIDVGLILRAQTDASMEDAFTQAYRTAVPYYVESGILVWRALNHDYAQLLRLSQRSSLAIDDFFFEHARKLERDTLVTAVAGLRVLSRVGEWVVLSEKEIHTDAPPLDYLDRVVLATFLTWCLLAHMTGQVVRARKANLKAVAETIMAVGAAAYQDALRSELYKSAEESQPWFWNPAWQIGEAEADRDNRLGDVKSSETVDELIRDLQGQ